MLNNEPHEERTVFYTQHVGGNQKTQSCCKHPSHSHSALRRPPPPGRGRGWAGECRWELTGPPTALQKAGGADGRSARRGGKAAGWAEFRLWQRDFSGNGRRICEGFRQERERSFTAECHFTEMERANCFLKAGKHTHRHRYTDRHTQKVENLKTHQFSTGLKNNCTLSYTCYFL